MRKKFAMMGLTLAGLIGCTPATMQSLRSNPAAQVRFETAQNYQSVYRTVITSARRCYNQAPLLVQGDLFSDIKSAEVTVAWTTAIGGHDVHMGIDIKAINDGLTEVRIYTAKSSESAPKTVRSWIENDATSCTS